MTTIIQPANIKQRLNGSSEEIVTNSRSIYKSSNHHSLKQWMTHSRHQHTETTTRTKETQNDNISGNTTITATHNDNHHLLLPPPPPSILLLDGGVSTHLEQKLTTTASSKTPVFSHRQLWSSSLLLTSQGQEDIQSTHVEFYDAGCDVISTVTYQCSHYHCDSHRRFVPSEKEEEDDGSCVGGFRREDGDGDDDGRRNLESSMSSVVELTQLPNYAQLTTTAIHQFKEDDIDDMIRMGVHLANQARHQLYQDHDTIGADQFVVGSSSNQSENEPKGDGNDDDDDGSKRGHHRSSNNMNTTKYIVASMGCYGAALANGEEYNGDYGDDCSIKDLIHFHQRRFDLLWNMSSHAWRIDDCNDAYCRRGSRQEGLSSICLLDALAFETVPCLMEVKAILHLLQGRAKADDMCSLLSGEEMEKFGAPQEVDEYRDEDTPTPTSSNVAIWISLACKDGQHLNDGTLLTEALDLIDEMDPKGTMVHGIGVNCIAINNAQSLIEIMAAHQLRSRLNRAIIFYPNSGEDWDPIHEKWREGSGCTSPELFASEIVSCIRKIYDMCTREGKNAGVIPILVGGCCRTSPETIAAIRRLVDNFLLSIKKL